MMFTTKKQRESVGKRVIYLGLLEQHLAIYGTVKSIEKVSKAVEYWQVQTDQGMTINGPSTSFEVCEYEEFQPGDKVKYVLDEGGYWEGVILYPHYGPDRSVYFLVRITNWEHGAVKVHAGYQFSKRPQSFKKLSQKDEGRGHGER